MLKFFVAFENCVESFTKNQLILLDFIDFVKMKYI